MNQQKRISLLVLAMLLLMHVSSVSGQTKLTIIQPDLSKEEIALDPESTVKLLDGGSLEVHSSEALSCGNESVCDIEFDFYTATTGGSTVKAGSSVTVEQGDSIRFDWSVRGGWQCYAEGLPGSGNWEGDAAKAYRTYGDPTQDANVVSTVNVAPDSNAYPASLTCTQGGKEVSAFVYVTITEPQITDPAPNDEFCAERPGLSEVSELVRSKDVLLELGEDGYLYSSVFGMEFPAFGVPQKKFRLNPGTYASMRFTTPSDLTGAGKWTFNELVGTSGGPRMVAISPCEGDFRGDLPDRCVLARTGTQAFRWTTDENDLLPGCLLTPGETYFLNIIYTNDTPGTWPVGWDCASADRCGHTVWPQLD